MDVRQEGAARQYAGGATTYQLADIYGVDPTTITRWVRDAGVPLRPRGTRPAAEAQDRQPRDITAAEARRLRKLYADRPEASRARTASGEPGRVTGGEGGAPLRAELRRLNAAGVSWEALGEALGLSKGAVVNVVRRG